MKKMIRCFCIAIICVSLLPSASRADDAVGALYVDSMYQLLETGEQEDITTSVGALISLHPDPKILIDHSVKRVQALCKSLNRFPDSQLVTSLMTNIKTNLALLSRYSVLLAYTVKHHQGQTEHLKPLFVSDNHCELLAAMDISRSIGPLASPYLKDVERIMKLDGVPAYVDPNFVAMGKMVLTNMDTDEAKAVLKQMEAE